MVPVVHPSVVTHQDDRGCRLHAVGSSRSDHKHSHLLPTAHRLSNREGIYKGKEISYWRLLEISDLTNEHVKGHGKRDLG